ncbi:hypothetical protein [Micrococcus sp.]|uniref:hypothetical protein n=1 Tax=Micrococcus sp. TaxID=1271 RepID=UPI002A915035|nr:hypothetical protein [Micrococcus sp.]MDY6054341.1 hypothetical protein [Micrococcus sp.]
MSASTRKPGDTLTGLGIAAIVLGIVVFIIVFALDGSASPVILLGWGSIGAALVMLGRRKARQGGTGHH